MGVRTWLEETQLLPVHYSRVMKIVPILNDFPRLILASGILLTGLYLYGAAAGPLSIGYDVLFLMHLLLFLLAVSGALHDFYLSTKKIENRFYRRLSISSLILILSCICAQAALPATARDALIHHLAVPKWWLNANTLAPFPWHDWSFYPMLLQLAYAGFLKWGLESFCAFYHGLYLILLAALVKRSCEKLAISASLSLTAFLITLSVPVCVKLGTVPLVDLGLAVFSTLAQFYMLSWIMRHERGSAGGAGVACGCALSTKLNAILGIGTLFPAFILTSLLKKIPLKSLLGFSLICVTIAGSIYGPWMLRAARYTGNPFYPLFPSFFAAHTAPPASSEGAAQEGSLVKGLSPLETRRYLHGESGAEIAALPLRIFIQGEDDNPRRFDGVLSPFLLLSLAGVFLLIKEPEKFFFSLSSWILILPALCLTDARIRYLAPVFGALVISSVAVLDMAARRYRQGAFLVLPSIALLHALPALWYGISFLFGSQGFMHVWMKGENREAYLRRSVADYEMVEFVNSRLPSHAKVYLLFTGNRFYYFERKVQSPGHVSTNYLVKLLRRERSAESILEHFQELDVTHLMINERRFAQGMKGLLSPPQIEAWNDFSRRYLKRVYSVRGSSLFEIIVPDDSPS